MTKNWEELGDEASKNEEKHVAVAWRKCGPYCTEYFGMRTMYCVWAALRVTVVYRLYHTYMYKQFTHTCTVYVGLAQARPNKKRARLHLASHCRVNWKVNFESHPIAHACTYVWIYTCNWKGSFIAKVHLRPSHRARHQSALEKPR